MPRVLLFSSRKYFLVFDIAKSYLKYFLVFDIKQSVKFSIITDVHCREYEKGDVSYDP